MKKTKLLDKLDKKIQRKKIYVYIFYMYIKIYESASLNFPTVECVKLQSVEFYFSIWGFVLD